MTQARLSVCAWLASCIAQAFSCSCVGRWVDEKIKAAIDPINAQLAEIKSKELTDIKEKLDEGERIQKRILATQISAQLRDLNRLRCTTSDATVRVRMEQDIEDAEQEYRALAGERYPLPACKDL
jgi:uncharacterized protein YfaQ (DUF2300 family)